MTDLSLKNNNIALNTILETVNSLSSGKEEQEKSIEITENGTTEILPDDGKTLSKVSITTNIEGGNSGSGDFIDIRNSLSSYNNDSLTKLETYTFAGCSSLTTVNLPACNYVEKYAFAYCRSLRTVNLPVCKSINSYDFSNCRSLTSINLPVCSTIGVCAFDYCISLRTLNLPACGSINNYAFQNCSVLTTLILGYSSIVKLANINVFNSTPMSVSTLTGSFGSIYVPASLVNAYKSATNWTTYADRITAIVE